jgi:hypothetical protein
MTPTVDVIFTTHFIQAVLLLTDAIFLSMSTPSPKVYVGYRDFRDQCGHSVSLKDVGPHLNRNHDFILPGLSGGRAWCLMIDSSFRLMTLLGAVLWSCLAGASAVLADHNITVDNADAQVMYTGAGAWTHGDVSAPFSPQSTFDSLFMVPQNMFTDSILPRVLLPQQGRPHRSSLTARPCTS